MVFRTQENYCAKQEAWISILECQLRDCPFNLKYKLNQDEDKEKSNYELIEYWNLHSQATSTQTRAAKDLNQKV